jgi:hypothetical protein
LTQSTSNIGDLLGDGDVFDELRDDVVVPLAVDVAFEGGGVEGTIHAGGTWVGKGAILTRGVLKASDIPYTPSLKTATERRGKP